MATSTQDWIDELKSISVLELSERIKALEEAFGVSAAAVAVGAPAGAGVKVLTSCPSCLQGLARFSGDTGAEADYIVVEMARHLLGPDWLPRFVDRANNGGIERVLL